MVPPRLLTRALGAPGEDTVVVKTPRWLHPRGSPESSQNEKKSALGKRKVKRRASRPLNQPVDPVWECCRRASSPSDKPADPARTAPQGSPETVRTLAKYRHQSQVKPWSRRARARRWSFFAHFAYKKMPVSDLFWDPNIFWRNLHQNTSGEYIREGKQVGKAGKSCASTRILSLGLPGACLWGTSRHPSQWKPVLRAVLGVVQINR